MERDAGVIRLLSVAARHPGVEENLLQGRPVRRLLGQTPANQLLALCDQKHEELTTRGNHRSGSEVNQRARVGTCRDFSSVADPSSQDLLVVFEGDVPAHHVIQQHAERPNGGRAAVVLTELDPLRRTVNPGPWRATKPEPLAFKNNKEFISCCRSALNHGGLNC